MGGNAQNKASEKHLLPMGPELSYLDEILENTVGGGNGANTLLTKREAEILQLIIAGKTNKEIAQKLYRTQRTVEYHRNRLMRKLGTHNTADLVKCAIAMGLT